MDPRPYFTPFSMPFVFLPFLEGQVTATNSDLLSSRASDRLDYFHSPHCLHEFPEILCYPDPLLLSPAAALGGGVGCWSGVGGSGRGRGKLGHVK